MEENTTEVTKESATNIENLNKTQVVLLMILVSVVVSFVTAIATAALYEQAPTSVTNTIQRVVEKATGRDASGSDQSVQVVTQEQRVIDIVQQTAPSVVSIVASKDLPVLEQCYSSPFGADDPFASLFPEFKVPQVCQKGTQLQQTSAGSGFFVSGNGLIVTNKHVVQDTEAHYTVLLNNGKKLEAKVLARDPLQDVALVKVEGSNFPALPLADSNSIKLGQTVIAIGNALGEFQNSVSAGIISGLKRTLVASGEELRAVIQTDATINPGNSGGPLINLEGRVVGINSAVAVGAENIGFALPINLVKKDIDLVGKGSAITYPFLGVQYQMLDEDLAKEKKLSVTEGALIASRGSSLGVSAGSPAEKAGLKEGDIITELGGEKVTKDNTLSDIIQRHRVGDTVSIKYLRGGKETTIQLQLVERKF